MNKKKLYIKTYGCQMNAYDSTRMADVLAPLGYVESEAPEDADLVVLNTCHIREKAAEKMYSDLGRIRLHKVAQAAQGKRLLIAVAGCVAQAEGEEIIARAPYVDMVVGPQSYHSLPDLIAEVERTRKSAVQLEFVEEQKFDLLPEALQPQGASAFVSIQEGCDKFCTFCVVPYTRGAEFSRPVAAILREVEAHLAQGAVEITLLGQNVNAYHGKAEDGSEVGLAALLHLVAALPGVKRLRYTTSHPRDVDDALIAAHGEIETLMPMLHLPVQSGSDRILKAMNRKHTAADYIGIVERLRAARPEMAFSSDFIVGFPGESEDDFEETLKLVETVGFASSYVFAYSPRPGTPAASREDQVPDAIKNARMQRLMQTISTQQLRFNRRMVGSTQPVLIERLGRKEGQVIGKTPFMQSVVLENAVHRLGQLVDVAIAEAYEFSLKGEVVVRA
ncbi:MAG: tRNA (N6-isopentenyl adenosine(37)-C2)-methylthiotransferase MiaB [Alphaproteobacteria bacterium]|nr:tRNA (N6-isopentenyl adenosine(37)-C2)-methylthiotransferase MiaB [Alphaproteobacteria bacterium]